MSNLKIDQRQRIFNRYSSNLHLLVDRGYLNIKLLYNKTYICPVCRRQFSETDLDQNSPNPLTLEDAPPKSLGGKANVLTCRECNNYCGQTMDSNLGVLLENKDSQDFAPYSKFWAEFVNKDGIKVRGTTQVNPDGTLTVLHDKKHNKPNSVDAFAESVTDELSSRYVTVKTKYKPFDHDIANYSLLKTAYLLMFKQLGYLFIFNEVYRRLTNQLLDVTTEIYPSSGWWNLSKEKILNRDYNLLYVHNPGMECFLVSFPLRTIATTFNFSVLIPCKLPVQYIMKAMDDIKSTADYIKLKPFIGLPFETYVKYELTDFTDTDILKPSDIHRVLKQIW